MSNNPRTIWFTGLPCSGKTTLARALGAVLWRGGLPIYMLDGDVIRKGLCEDLAFSEADRHENLRRVAHVAKILNDTGYIVLASFISPMEADRRMVCEIIGSVFIVYVRCSPEICAERDVKGMWAKAAAGEITGFTGYDAPYEEPIGTAHYIAATGERPLEDIVSELAALIKEAL